MRKLFLLLGCLLSSASVFAASGGRSSGSGVASGGSSSSDIQAANNQFGVQSVATSVSYTENGNGRLGSATGVLDTETGTVPGIGFYFSMMKDVLLGNDYFKATYAHFNGQTNYVGASLNNGGGYGSVVGTSAATMTDYSVRYGKGLVMRNSSMLTPYVEIGSHTWVRGVNYGETYSDDYYGVGLLSQSSFGNSMVLSVDAMYGRTVQSAISVVSGAGVGGFSGPLGDSEYYKVGVSLDYRFSRRIHGNIGVDYTAFAYGISAVYPIGGKDYWEPDSQTNYTTVRVGLGWGF